MKPILILLGGHNGAGKTTLYQNRVAPAFAHPFINADFIQKEEMQDPSLEASYEAAQIASSRRTAHIANGESFAAETVFSHPSKLDLITNARKNGYNVILMHVGTNHPDIAVARVQARVKEGGHDVPVSKIIERYHRCIPLLKHAMLHVDLGMVFDNSHLNTPPKKMLTFFNGGLFKQHTPLADWVDTHYIKGDLSSSY